MRPPNCSELSVKRMVESTSLVSKWYRQIGDGEDEASALLNFINDGPNSHKERLRVWVAQLRSKAAATMTGARTLGKNSSMVEHLHLKQTVVGSNPISLKSKDTRRVECKRLKSPVARQWRAP